MSYHLNEQDQFQSEQYPDMRPDEIVLSLRDPAAMEALYVYADMTDDDDLAVPILKRLEAIAGAKKCTVAQLALAWILHQGDFFVPIPGTYKISHLENNAAAAGIHLTREEQAAIDRIFPPGVVAGTRHDYDRSKELNI